MINEGGRIRSLEQSTLFRWFFIYSVMGWLYETIFCFTVSGNLSKRGFLFGPLCPIYGISILIMILICSDKSKKLPNLIIRCALVATAIEYITSFWMEYFFERRWWDYSHMFMNINGRVCIGATVLFGVLGALFVRLIHPVMVSLTNRISSRIIRTLDKAILFVFLYDILLSIRANIIKPGF